MALGFMSVANHLRWVVMQTRKWSFRLARFQTDWMKRRVGLRRTCLFENGITEYNQHVLTTRILVKPFDLVNESLTLSGD